jgi:hypothetical protein
LTWNVWWVFFGCSFAGIVPHRWVSTEGNSDNLDAQTSLQAYFKGDYSLRHILFSFYEDHEYFIPTFISCVGGESNPKLICVVDNHPFISRFIIYDFIIWKS